MSAPCDCRATRGQSGGPARGPRHRGALRRAVGLLVALSMCLGAAPARAQAAHETVFFDSLGRRAFARGDYRAALRYFLLAKQTASSVGMAYNVAVTADLAGEPVLAYVHLVDYLARSDDDPSRRRDAEQRVERLRGELALVRLATTPEGAEVFVDRRDLGSVGRTPREIPVLPGNRVLELEREGFEPVRLPLVAVRGETREVAIDLTPRRGWLSVRVSPAGARLRLVDAGARVTTLEGDQRRELPVGEYVLEASAPGYTTEARRVKVVAESPVLLVVALHRVPVATGALVVAAGPLAASLYVDGRLRGAAPARVAPLPVGEHIIELQAAGHAPWTGTVRIEAGKTAYLNATLRTTDRRGARGRRLSASP